MKVKLVIGEDGVPHVFDEAGAEVRHIHTIEVPPFLPGELPVLRVVKWMTCEVEGRGEVVVLCPGCMKEESEAR